MRRGSCCLRRRLLSGFPGEFAVSGGVVLWRVLLDEATDRLTAAGVDSAAAEARQIVVAAAGCDDSAWHGVLSRPATRRGVASLDRMLGRRVAGEPLQYVLGAWAFRTLDLFVDPRVLIPRPETEIVAGHALDELQRRAAGNMLLAADLGCGSGAIGLSLVAERVDVEVVCTDVSPDALAVASANLAGLGRPARRVRLAEGSWYEALPTELRGRLDVIVSNPPYIATGGSLPPEIADHEPPVALYSGSSGLEATSTILAGAPEWLAPGGAVVLELADGTAGRVQELANSAGLADVAVHPDLTGIDRVLIARRPS